MTDVLTADEATSEVTGGSYGLLTLPDGRSIPARFHPLADLFPMIEGAAFTALCDDVRANGVQRPIVLLDGHILDGRNRYLAAREVGCGYKVTDFVGSDPVKWVISENIHRRHLTESQRAMVAARLAKLPKGRPEGNASIEAVSQPQAADMLNVGRASVQRAAEVQRDAAPEVQRLVESGNLSVTAAAQMTALSPSEQIAVVEAGPAAVREKVRELREERAARTWRDRVAELALDERLAVAARLIATGERIDDARSLAESAGVDLWAVQWAVRRLTLSRTERQAEADDIRRVLAALGRDDVIVPPSPEAGVREVERDAGLEIEWRQGFSSAALMLGDSRRPTDPEAGQAWDEGHARFETLFEAFMKRERA